MERDLEAARRRLDTAREEAAALVGKVAAVAQEAGRVVDRSALAPAAAAVGRTRRLIETACGGIAPLAGTASQIADVAVRLDAAEPEPTSLDVAVSLAQAVAAAAESVAAGVEAVLPEIETLDSATRDAAASAATPPAIRAGQSGSEALRDALARLTPAAGDREIALDAVERAREMACETVAALATLRDRLAASARLETVESLHKALPDLRTATAATFQQARALVGAAAAARVGIDKLRQPAGNGRAVAPAEAAAALRAMPPLIEGLGKRLDALAAGTRILDRDIAAGTVETLSLGAALGSARVADEALAEVARLLAPRRPAEPAPGGATASSPEPPKGLGRRVSTLLGWQAGEKPKVDLCDPAPALERAGLLIRYAAEHAIDLRGVDLVAVLAFRETLANEKRPTAYEQDRFWKAYAGLVAAVRPATPDSIRERADFEIGSKPLPLLRATRDFRRAMLLSLVVALGVSWYYSALDAPVARAGSARQAFAEAQEGLVLARAQAVTAAAASTPTAVGGEARPAPTPAEIDARVNDQARVSARKAMCGAVTDWRSSLDYLAENRPGSLPGQLAGAVVTLVRAAVNVPSAVLGYGSVPDPAGTAAIAVDAAGRASATVDQGGERLRAEVCRQGLADTDRLVRVELGAREDFVLLEEAKGWRDRIATYLLPLFYGLLGSLAHIVRTLRDEIVNVTFTLGTYTILTVRWLLGALAGVTIGLAVQPETLTSLQGITQLGIAFLAGYSVDILFNFLDRFQLTQPRQQPRVEAGGVTALPRATP